MEDQQPRSGGLTDAPSGDAEADDTAEPGPDTDIDAESPAETDAAAATPGAENADAGAPVKRQTPRLLTGAVAASVALFIGSAAFAGAAVQPYLADRAAVVVKLKIAETAAAAISTLWNYTPENMDSLPDRASIYLSGDLAAQYRKFIDAIAETNKQAKVTDSTQIVGAAVESLNGPEATVIVYTNTTATSELQKSIPSLKYLSYRLSMKRDHNRWVITKMPTITSLDLTPRL